MQVVIEMPDRIYRTIQKRHLNIIDMEIVENAIRNGTPLPKEHGDLVDIDEVFERMKVTKNYDILVALTRVNPIIEADKEE